jgi:hypothetical protein
MNDRQMIEHLRTYAHWTREQPWKQIADRLEQLIEDEYNEQDQRLQSGAADNLHGGVR